MEELTFQKLLKRWLIILDQAESFTNSLADPIRQFDTK